MNQNKPDRCFNCKRSENEIPMLSWSYQGRPFRACCQCVPTLIHKWEQVITGLAAQPTGVQDE
ncbi:MAG: hypothetical protein R6X32_16305 [Chloroflexota bacterium]|jgi:hypothetical protein